MEREVAFEENEEFECFLTRSASILTYACMYVLYMYVLVTETVGLL